MTLNVYYCEYIHRYFPPEIIEGKKKTKKEAKHLKRPDEPLKSFQILTEILPPEQKIEIRSDGGTEFNNETVKQFCSKNNILLHIIPKVIIIRDQIQLLDIKVL